MKIGIVGLGNMGLGIAENLIRKGYSVYGYDINPARGSLLEEQGGHKAESCAALGKEVDTVILMVFSPENLWDVLLGEGGLAGTLAPGSTVLVTASVGPEIIDRVEPELISRKIGILDVPLMASVDSARAGQMHILVSGEKKLVERYQGLLKDMGRELYHVGDAAGMGQAGKMCLQTLFSLTFETAFEIVTLVKKLNLDEAEMDRLFHNSGSTSELFHETQENARKRVFTGTFNPLSILDKDIRLSVEMARKLHMELPASEGTAKVFREAMKHYATEDIWAAVKVIEKEK